MVQLYEVLTVKHLGGQSLVQRDAPIDRAITSFLGCSPFISAALPHRRQPRGGQECRRYCRGPGRTVDDIIAILHHVLCCTGQAQFLLLVPLNLAIIYLDIIQVVPISKRLFVSLGHPKYTGARSKYKSRYVF